MKKSRILLLLSIPFLLLFYGGCDLLNGVDEVTFDTSFQGDIAVDVSGTNRNESFNESILIDPTSDDQVAKYLDKIKGFDIKSVTAEVIKISEDLTLVTAKVEIFNQSKQAVWNYSDVYLTPGAFLTMNNNNGQWDTVSQILMDKLPFTVNLSGEVDKSNVSFTLRITIETTVTAEAL